MPHPEGREVIELGDVHKLHKVNVAVNLGPIALSEAAQRAAQARGLTCRCSVAGGGWQSLQMPRGQGLCFVQPDLMR